jgi:hypothetical protein
MQSGFSVFSYYNVEILIRMIKSMRMRWGGHVACMGKKIVMHTEFWWESQRERDH